MHICTPVCLYTQREVERELQNNTVLCFLSCKTSKSDVLTYAVYLINLSLKKDFFLKNSFSNEVYKCFLPFLLLLDAYLFIYFL